MVREHSGPPYFVQLLTDPQDTGTITQMQRSVLIIFGTRPEFIKLAPVVLALRDNADFNITVCNTGQHEELLESVAEAFPIITDLDLNLMQRDRPLWSFLGTAIETLGEVVAQQKPDMVIAQGDTSTTLAAAWAAFLNRVPFLHIEAGLRTGDDKNPFPEEGNRRTIAQLTSHHFAPTPLARDNLLREGVDLERITVTGNTVVDALKLLIPKLPTQRVCSGSEFGDAEKTILLTLHRRENFGVPTEQVCRAVRELLQQHPDLRIVFPVHPNPGVSTIVRELLENTPRVELLPPVSYPELLCLIRDSYLVLTDSGGIQEEAPSFAKPVLLLRKVTERPEAVRAGYAEIVGTSTATIVEATNKLLANRPTYERMCAAENPFGDGNAAGRIVEKLKTL